MILLQARDDGVDMFYGLFINTGLKAVYLGPPKSYGI